MGSDSRTLFTFFVGFALGAAASTIAKGKGTQPKKTAAGVCRDLKLIHDQAIEDSTEAFENGKVNAGEKHEADAKFTKEWANKGGCGWAS
jgi:hypothetical protein